jgi:hypothetical protein
VLEHMEDPAAALVAARTLLTPEGCVVASVPNVRNVRVLVPLLLRGRWDYQESGPLDRTHLRFFTRATMRELFECAGYQVRQQEPIKRTRVGGRLWSLYLLGSHREQFLVEQYLIVATPRSDSDSHANPG